MPRSCHGEIARIDIKQSRIRIVISTPHGHTPNGPKTRSLSSIDSNVIEGIGSPAKCASVAAPGGKTTLLYNSMEGLEKT